MPTVYNGSQSLLEKYAIEGFGNFRGRDSLLAKNTYNNETEANNYSATHTRALADSKTPEYGKGTGQFLDTENYNAGSSLDINGNQLTAMGSGRNKAFSNNLGTFGYDPKNNYKKPDTSKNKGVLIIYS